MKKFITVLIIGLSFIGVTAYASLKLNDNYNPSVQLPLDARTVKTTTITRDAIPSNQRYDGLTVYVVADNITYQLQGGITNSNWVSLGTGGGNIWDLVAGNITPKVLTNNLTIYGITNLASTTISQTGNFLNNFVNTVTGNNSKNTENTLYGKNSTANADYAYGENSTGRSINAFGTSTVSLRVNSVGASSTGLSIFHNPSATTTDIKETYGLDLYNANGRALRVTQKDEIRPAIETNAQIMVAGVGQASTTAIDPTEDLNASIEIKDTNIAAGSGGMILFGANNNVGSPLPFSGIKAILNNGVNYTTGKLGFFSRLSSGNTYLSLVGRIVGSTWKFGVDEANSDLISAPIMTRTADQIGVASSTRTDAVFQGYDGLLNNFIIKHVQQNDTLDWTNNKIYLQQVIGDAPQMYVSYGGANDAGVYQPSLRFGFNTTDWLTILNTGRVGIGTSYPNNTFQVVDLIDFDNTYKNTKIGYQAGSSTVNNAVNNTFVGYQAGLASSTGSTGAADNNVAIGYQAMFSNAQGYENTAVGSGALYSNEYGIDNTAIGYRALSGLTSGYGYSNLALGAYAGAHEQGNYSFYLDNQDRTTNDKERTEGMMYGTFNVNPALQELRINASTTFPYVLNVFGNIVAGTGITLGGVNRTSWPTGISISDVISWYDSNRDWHILSGLLRPTTTIPIYAPTHLYVNGNLGVGTTSPIDSVQIEKASPSLGIYATDYVGDSILTFGNHISDGSRLFSPTWQVISHPTNGGTANQSQIGDLIFKGLSAVTDTATSEFVRITNLGVLKATSTQFTNSIITNSTTTNATTTNLAVSTSFNFLGTVITNVGTWFNNLFDTRLSATTSLPNLTTLSGLTSIGSASATTTILGGFNAHNTLYVDSASDKVGIGTTAPGNKLTVKGLVDATYPVIVQQLSVGSTDSAAINKGGGIGFGGSYTGTTQTEFAAIRGLKENAADSDYAGYLSFVTRQVGDAGTEKMRITSGGNVGIGTSSPSQLLTVGNNNQFTVGSSGNVVAGYSIFHLLTGIDKDHPIVQVGANLAAGNYLEIYGGTADGATMHIATNYYASDGPLALGTYTTPDTITLLTNGNVGIGTTAPAKILHVAAGNSGYTWTPNYRNGIFSESSGDNIFRLINGSSTAGLSEIWFGDQSSEVRNRIRFKSATQEIDLGDSGIIIDNAAGIALVGVAGCTSGIKSAATTGQLSCITSDASLKKDVGVMPSTIDKVMALQPKTYKWTNASDGTELNYGLLAQDVESVYPDLVFQFQQGVKSTTTLKGINWNNLTAILLKSVQEIRTDTNNLWIAISSLITRQNDQEKRITDLETQNKLLLDRITVLEAKLK